MSILQNQKKTDFMLFAAICFLILSLTMPWFGSEINHEVKFGAFDGTVSRFDISVQIWLLVLFALVGATLCLTRVKELTSAPWFFSLGLLVFSLTHTSVLEEASTRDFRIYSGYLCGQIGILIALAVTIFLPCADFFRRRQSRNEKDEN